MSGYSFADEWPGRQARGHRKHHRHGPPNWPFPRGGKGRHGRPTPEEIEQLIELRRMGGGPGWFGRGPRGRGRGRARRGDVRLALLRLIAEEPRNGYQLMQTIEERSGGRWRPSPGSVYPTLAQLEDEGLVRSTESEGARRFEITEAGREHLDTRTDEPDPWEPPVEESESPLADLGPLVIQIGKATFQVASVGDPAQRDRARALLGDTRRALYRILADDGTEAETDDEPRTM